jgi:hemolysin III
VCSDLNSPSTTVVEVLIFVCMGYGLVLVCSAVVATLSDIALRLLLCGGVAYTVGIIFFALGEYKPIFHVIWHLFVVLGAALHWFDVYFYIAPIKFDAKQQHAVPDCKVQRPQMLPRLW